MLGFEGLPMNTRSAAATNQPPPLTSHRRGPRTRNQQPSAGWDPIAVMARAHGSSRRHRPRTQIQPPPPPAHRNLAAAAARVPKTSRREIERQGADWSWGHVGVGLRRM